MNPCEVCASDCENDICTDCQYRMASGDNSDILRRVQDHCNDEYEMDYVKFYICQHFEISGWEGTGRKEPQITAKQLFIYALLTRFKMRIVDICKMLKIDHCTVHYIRNKWNKKMRCELTKNKYQPLINAK